MQEFPDAPQAGKVSHADRLGPLGLADRKQDATAIRVVAEGGDIHLVGLLLLWVVDQAAANLRRRDAVDLGRRVGLHPVTADLLESRADDGSDEPVSAVAPDLSGLAAALQAAPLRPHDRMIEGNQRLADPVHAAARAEDVDIAREQPGILEDRQVVGDVGGLALQVAGNASARAVPSATAESTE